MVIDNSAGRLDSEFGEISIVRRLDRSGEGEYRLNGARCRLADVVEVLSDTGLGKEMHSVVSQGRVESIVLSRPRERRLLIEEAAGLGKHRKRRRRAQLKLERTEENLSRALDVEREARSRLRPLKRQAEAAQLHERLERQTHEARYELAREEVRVIRSRLAEAESAAASARGPKDRAESELAAVAGRTARPPRSAFAALTREREELQARSYAARSAHERIGLRAERARDQARAAAEGARRRRAQLELLDSELADVEDPGEEAAGRVAALEAERERLDAARDERVRDALAELEQERADAEELRASLAQAGERSRAALESSERAADTARGELREAERLAESARADAARVGAELAAVNQFLRSAAPAAGGAMALSERLDVEPGYELALAAALGPRLAAGVVNSVRRRRARARRRGRRRRHDAGGSRPLRGGRR